MSNLTIIGMEQYLNYYDDSLFADAVFPDDIDKDLAVNTILIRSGEFETLYSDAEFLKGNITRWASQYYYTFQKWVEGFAAEFNPVENYDRFEDWTDTHNNKFIHGKTETLTHGKTETLTHGKTETITHDTTDKTTYDTTENLNYGKSETLTHGHTLTTENEKSAYNYNTYVNDTKTTERHGGNDVTTDSGVDMTEKFGSDTLKKTGTETTANSGNDTTKFTGDDKTVNSGTDVDSGGSSHTARIHGNIGIKTATSMLEEYMQFYKTTNLYDLIADIFVTEFCIMIY